MTATLASRSANVGEYLLEQADHGDVAVIDRTGSHSYGELVDAARALASAMARWRLPVGSRIGLLSRNSFFWAAAYLAILRAGHVVVPFATGLTPADVAAKAEFVGCAGFMVDRTLARRFQLVLAETEHVLDDDLAGLHADTDEAAEPVESDDDAVLVFTSGTTSAPRAVRVTHGNIAANTEAIVEYLELDRDDRMLVVLPFSYCFGASLLHTHLRVGGSVAICDTFAFPETVIEAIERDRCTGFAGVPSSYQLLLRASSFSSTRLPSLRHMQQAGGRLPIAQIRRLVEAQPDARMFVMYGQTEATARLSYLPPALIEERAGSIGRGVPGVTLTVVDELGREVEPGTVGEIVARGASITKGYWRDPEGTAAKFVDGALRTGDLARTDDEGFIYVVDRQDDFIKSWGFRVSSHEVEEAALAAPGVAATAVVGRADPDAGEAIVLFYVAAAGADPTPDEVIAQCRSVLARHLVPHEAHRLDDLPLNSNGKVVKADLRALAARLSQSAESDPTSADADTEETCVNA